MPSYRLIATALSCFGLMAFTASLAQPINEDAMVKAIDAVVAEHQVYATCLSLEPQGLSLVQESWRREVAQAADSLKSLKASPALLIRFVSATDVSRLFDGSMRLSAAVDLCRKNEATVRKFYEFGYTRLAAAVEAAARQSKK